MAQGAAQDASIGGGSFSGGAKACTKPIVDDLQNGGQDRALCLGLKGRRGLISRLGRVQWLCKALEDLLTGV